MYLLITEISVESANNYFVTTKSQYKNITGLDT